MAVMQRDTAIAASINYSVCHCQHYKCSNSILLGIWVRVLILQLKNCKSKFGLKVTLELLWRKGTSLVTINQT